MLVASGFGIEPRTVCPGLASTTGNHLADRVDQLVPHLATLLLRLRELTCLCCVKLCNPADRRSRVQGRRRAFGSYERVDPLSMPTTARLKPLQGRRLLRVFESHPRTLFIKFVMPLVDSSP